MRTFADLVGCVAHLLQLGRQHIHAAAHVVARLHDVVGHPACHERCPRRRAPEECVVPLEQHALGDGGVKVRSVGGTLQWVVGAQVVPAVVVDDKENDVGARRA